MPQKRQGIRLRDQAEPDTPHFIPGLRGYYRPGLATPVGQPGDVFENLEDAKQAVKEHSGALELVEIPAGEAREAEAQAKADLAAARNELPKARRDGRAEETPARFKAERDAVKTEEGGQ